MSERERTPAEHAATVRKALESIAYRSPANNAQGNLNIAREKAVLSLPALDALEAQAEEARSLVDEARRATEAMEAAEAEREQLRGELLRAIEDSNHYHDKWQTAEAERDRLGNALAQERAKPGGSYDQAAYDQLAARVEELKAALGRTATTLETITDRFIPGIDTWEDTDAEESLEIALAALDKDTAWSLEIKEDDWHQAYEKAKERVEQLTEALREVTDEDTPTSEVRRIARDALDKDTA